jgi:hypothetical protein
MCDSGASHHITPCKERLINYEPIVPWNFQSTKNSNFQTIGKGDMLLKVPGPRNMTLKVLINGILYAPQVGITLMATSKVVQHVHIVLFTDRYCKVLISKGKFWVLFLNAVGCIESSTHLNMPWEQKEERRR